MKTEKKPSRKKNAATTGQVPNLRFPEFRHAPAWEKRSLANLSSCGLSNGVFNDPKKMGTGYKLINVLDMYIESYIDEDILSDIALSENDFAKNKVNHGDIFFTRSSLVKSGIACSNIYLGDACNITFDCHLIRFRPDCFKIIPLFIHYNLKTSPVRGQLIACGKTATMTTIGQRDVGNIHVYHPAIDEQKKIAECLSSVDGLIAAQARKLDALKLHKKGLMQQLFPAAGGDIPS